MKITQLSRNEILYRENLPNKLSQISDFQNSIQYRRTKSNSNSKFNNFKYETYNDNNQKMIKIVSDDQPISIEIRTKSSKIF